MTLRNNRPPLPRSVRAVIAEEPSPRRRHRPLERHPRGVQRAMARYRWTKYVIDKYPWDHPKVKALADHVEILQEWDFERWSPTGLQGAPTGFQIPPPLK